jgi:nicotinamidase/pyrazinamidase
VTTQDWHVDPGPHFARPPAAPDFVDTWPPHGVASTTGAELHPALAGLSSDAGVKKGTYVAAYSGFEGVDGAGRSLQQILHDGAVTDVDVVGIAESHSVRATTLDPLGLGMGARVLTDLTVPFSPEQGAAAREAMVAAGAELVRSDSL